MRLCAFAPLLITVSLVIFTGSATASPSVEFQNTVLDIGKVLAGSKVNGTLSFKNAGNETLEIIEISAPCDCMEAKASALKVPAGESSAIEIIFKTGSYKGQVSKTVTIISNDPIRPVVELEVKALVEPIATMTPERFNFGTIEVSSTVEKVVAIKPLIRNGFDIVKIEPVGTHVKVKDIKKPRDENGVYSVTLLIAAGDRPGRVKEQVRVTTSLPGNPVLEILVYGNIKGQSAGDAKSF
ncbi:MAG: DUF1573 domain-containing protein [Armatimonadetes bacterium]|nr:DUF1573 domain-containing protein [Armatimonadota bacterium]